MRPTDILMSEHRVIEQVLECLEKLAKQCVKEQALDRAAARQIVDFFQTFADRCHHVKEETLLFPLMEERGFSRDTGPTGVMRHEHELSRHYLLRLADIIDEAGSGSSAAVHEFASLANAYIVLLREHIAKEDHRLFPMVNQRLTEQDQWTLLEEFEDVESGKLQAGTHEKCLETANELADRFGVPRVHFETVATHGHSSCGHHG
jgi:hemerythrin-like domain-containing protein